MSTKISLSLCIFYKITCLSVGLLGSAQFLLSPVNLFIGGLRKIAVSWAMCFKCLKIKAVRKIVGPKEDEVSVKFRVIHDIYGGHREM